MGIFLPTVLSSLYFELMNIDDVISLSLLTQLSNQVLLDFSLRTIVGRPMGEMAG